MRWPARFRDDESGFTLVELIIGMAITGIIIIAIGSALFVALGTTNVTNKRMSESHDVQISSAYLANDVQSTKDGGVRLGPGGDCGGTPTTLVTFAFATGQAVYACGLATNGETQVTRSFGAQTIVLAHFASALSGSQPTVTCTPNANCAGSVDSVTMSFTEASGYSYTLYGARRLYNAAPGGGGTTSPPLTLLATGGNSPLWVQGGCTGGANSDCLAGGTNSLPASDLAITDWTPVPVPTLPCPATSLWCNLSDASNTSYVVNAANKKTQAKLAMTSVAPPTGGNPVIDVVAAAACTGCPPATGNQNQATLTVTLYNGASSVSHDFQIDPAISPAVPLAADLPVWQLTNGDMNKIGSIPDSAYTGTNGVSQLTIGFAMTAFRNGAGISTRVNVYGLALDTASTTGTPVLKVIGGLYVNSTLGNAVWLTGKKAVNKLTIVGAASSCTSGSLGCFQIQTPGACTGCNSQTVTCSNADCRWHSVSGYTGLQPWMNFSPPIPDPLAYMSAPAQPPSGSCGGGVCTPGFFNFDPNITSDTRFDPGVYYLTQGLSIAGNAKITGSGVTFFVLNGGLSFGGTADVSLTPPTSGPFQNILVFQWRCPGSNPILNPCPGYPPPDTSNLKITGGSSATLTFGGVIYAPASNLVSLSGGNANLNVTAVVAQNVKVSGNAQVTVGV